MRVLVVQDGLGRDLELRVRPFDLGHQRNRLARARHVDAGQEPVVGLGEFADLSLVRDDEDRHAVRRTRFAVLALENVRHGGVEQLQSFGELANRALGLVAVDHEMVAARLAPLGPCDGRREHQERDCDQPSGSPGARTHVEAAIECDRLRVKHRLLPLRPTCTGPPGRCDDATRSWSGRTSRSARWSCALSRSGSGAQRRVPGARIGSCDEDRVEHRLEQRGPGQRQVVSVEVERPSGPLHVDSGRPGRERHPGAAPGRPAVPPSHRA